MNIRTLIVSSMLMAAVPAAWSIPSPSLDDSSDSAPAASAPGAAPSAADSATYTEALGLMKQGDDLSAETLPRRQRTRRDLRGPQRGDRGAPLLARDRVRELAEGRDEAGSR